MKHFFYGAVTLVLFSCKENKAIVEPSFIDSLISNYQPSSAAVTNEKDLNFWKRRVDSLPENFVNLEKYASALGARFHIYGNISDLKTADSILQKLSGQYKEPHYLLSLAGYKMLQHQFDVAGQFIDTVVQMKGEKYAAQMMLFDASFELGNIYRASLILKNNYSPKDYAYNFRLAKLDHYQGNWDSAIAHMMKAADLANSNIYLRNAALSNAADLYLHNGKFRKAAELYKECIRSNSSDFHSLMGLGWTTLMHDSNDTLVKKLFQFVHQKSQSPDVLLKLSQVFELNDTTVSKKYAQEFVEQISRPSYGNMYNKYLIQLYTGILNDAEKAVGIAKKEITHRPTSQTYSWLAWSLFCNGQKKEAYEVYSTYVSGKALEALELYWMGKLMKGMNKGYNARQFFKAANENKYDLSPAMKADLEKNL